MKINLIDIYILIILTSDKVSNNMKFKTVEFKFSYLFNQGIIHIW